MKYLVKINYKFYGEKVIEADSQDQAFEIAEAMDLDDFECIDVRDFIVADIEEVV
jgi:hypothetical protein